MRLRRRSAWKKRLLSDCPFGWRSLPTNPSTKRRCVRSPSSMPSRRWFADRRWKRGSLCGASSPHRSSRPSAAALAAQLPRNPTKDWPKSSRLAKDIRYALAHWSGLTRFLEDGRLELDTNPVENQIRKIALTRKNALFAGHEVGAEKLGDARQPHHQLQDGRHRSAQLLVPKRCERCSTAIPKRRIDELMPSSFAVASSQTA